MDKVVHASDVIGRFNDLLDQGRLDEAEALLQQSVETIPEEERTGPFAAPMRLRPDPDHPEYREGFLVDAANALSRSLRNARYSLQKATGHPGVRIVETGDSWHQYPVRLQDLIDNVMADHAIYSLSAAGATMADIEVAGDALEGAIRAENPVFLLLSCGGNDILGAPLGAMLKPYAEGLSAQDLIHADRLDANVAQIVAGYGRICRRARRAKPALRIVLHGYDYVLPRKSGGSWLKKPLEAKGIPFDIGRAVLRHIVDRFNEALAGFAQTYPGGGVFHVDLRGSVGEKLADWHDEIHPADPGFARAARRIRNRLNSLYTLVPPGSLHEALSEAAIDGPERGAALARAGLLGTPTVTRQDMLDGLKRRGAVDPLAEGQRMLEIAQLDGRVREAWQHLQELYDVIDAPEDPRRVANRMHYSYRDGLRNFERIIGQNDIDEFFVLERGVRAGRAVARLNVRAEMGGGASGTGFLVAPGLLLTNNHVLPNRAAARGCTASFDYELTEQGIPKPAHHFRLNDAVFVTSERLDYTFVGVTGTSSDGKPLAHFGWNTLLPLSGKAVKREFVNIIQHPGGTFKKVVLRENLVIGRRSDFIYYVADTEPGSSGGCVTNVEWQVAALHHMAVPDPKDPNSFIANRGVRISSILGDIRQRSDARDPDAEAVEAMLDAADRTGPPVEAAPAPPFVESVAMSSAGTVFAPEEDEGSREGLDAEGEIYRSSQAPVYEAAAPRLSTGNVAWPGNPKNSPDTWHLAPEMAETAFALSTDVLAGLMEVGAYQFLTPDNPRLVVSLRGCRLASGAGSVEDASEIEVQAQRPDHQTFRCLIGVWDRERDRLSLYTASTVPNRGAMLGYYNKVNFKGPGDNCNLLPTGYYRHSVGTHYGKGGQTTRVLRLGTGPEVKDASEATVLRTSNDLVYGTADDWDKTVPHDNIHPAFGTGRFSSAGCLTVRGSQTPGGSHDTATGEWRAFRAKAGFDVAPKGTMYDNLLVTGHEAAAVASAMGSGAPMASLACLRHGSRGAHVDTLQAQIGEPVDGQFGARTRKTLAVLQDRTLGFATGTWTPEMAALLGLTF